MGASVGDDGGGKGSERDAGSNGTLGVGATTGAEIDAGPFAGAPAGGAMGAAVEVVGVAEDTGAAASEADKTGPAMTA
jgi:hypothetical protein